MLAAAAEAKIDVCDVLSRTEPLAERAR